MKVDDRKIKAKKLRASGYTYQEISEFLGGIPKTTLSTWLARIEISRSAKKKIDQKKQEVFRRNLKNATAVNKKQREEYFKSIEKRNESIVEQSVTSQRCKVLLAMLYLGEGNKQGGSICFGNSNEKIIRIFLQLLRRAYVIDESKFRVTVQCRADQNVQALEIFWREVTGIPKRQFYKARVDPRTIGVTSKKPEYKGVCRIDYFSADVFNELSVVADLTLRAVSSVG